MNSLDLYAGIEPLIGFYTEYERLYQCYFELLEERGVRSVLDVGCGNGRFLEMAAERGYDGVGIDISERMREIAKERGVDVYSAINDVSREFDAAVLIADVLNYIPKERLGGFLEEVCARIKHGGWLLYDCNTLHGFEDITAGTLVSSYENLFLAIDAEFDGDVLHTKIDYFQKDGECYRRESGEIEQFYHPPERIDTLLGHKPKERFGFSLFSDEPDKEISLFEHQPTWRAPLI